ncbi:MAG: hypothetical protein ACLT4C_10830 [Butyricicoccus sp.]
MCSTAFFECIRQWDEFGIDGLRLDVAYCLDKIHPCAARPATRSRPTFLVGELLRRLQSVCRRRHAHSCTNYECYKGLYSSMNSCNLFEMHSLLRRFGRKTGRCIKASTCFRLWITMM